MKEDGSWKSPTARLYFKAARMDPRVRPGAPIEDDLSHTAPLQFTRE